MAVPYIFSTIPGGAEIPLAYLDANFGYLTNGSTTSPTIMGSISLTGNLAVAGTSNFTGNATFNNATINGTLTIDGSTVNPTGTTGTGLLVFNNSPVLINPALGTPQSGNLSNCTSFPVVKLSGLAPNVLPFLTNPTSATLSLAVTDETGSGSLVFSNNPVLNSPTLLSPVLNTPASGNLANCTNLPASGVVGVMTVGQGGTGLSTTGTVGQIIGVTAPNTLGYIIQPPASGIAAGAASQVLYQSAPNVTAFVPNGAAGQVLTSNGVAAPSWTNLNAANLSGVLPVANGGTGITSLGAGVQSALGIATNTPGGFVTGPQNTVPPGAVMYFAMNTAPSGWLFCNGASVSTATYANLFAAIGYTYGGSGGSFNIPNLNGQFIRSWDASGAVDPSRVFGSNQNDAYENHTHTATSTDAGHVHQISGTGPNANGGGGGWLVNPQGFLTPTQTGQANITTTVNASTTGGNETRPVNVALYACIKF